VHTDFLLYRLEYDTLHTLEDLKESLAVGTSLYLEAQDRAAWILQAERLIEWLSNGNSTVLVVNGNEARHEFESAVSFLSAMVLSVLRDMAKISHDCVRLHWFCGRNTDSNLYSMTSELLGQLLLDGKPSLPLLNIDWRFDEDFHAIVKAFCACIKEQLRYCPVFIVIDMISAYEGRDRIKDLRYLYKRLSSLADDSEKAYALKVLFTSPTHSSYFGTYDDKWSPELLEVPDVVDGDLSGINDESLVEQMTEKVHMVGRI
jgi:hypothetical protein